MTAALNYLMFMMAAYTGFGGSCEADAATTVCVSATYDGSADTPAPPPPPPSSSDDRRTSHLPPVAISNGF